MSPVLRNSSWLLAVWLCICGMARAAEPGQFEIQVIDQQTGRGVPLVELETVNRLRFMTDSAGRVAVQEAGWFGQEIFFHVRSHGYELPKDGFGFAGVWPTPQPGGKATISLRRQNIAERLYRITGEGIYRDSVLLGYAAPIKQPVLNAGVVGQDSVQTAVYRGKIHWFWGDTSLARYPLGNFRTSGATSALPSVGGLNPEQGVDLTYFTDAKGISRDMCPLERAEGPVWVDGLVVVPDAQGRERMVVHYARMKSLEQMAEHGLAVWNDEKQEFERATKLGLEEHWRFLRGHPVQGRGVDAEWLYCGDAFPTVRVHARLEEVLNPAAYQALTLVNREGKRTRDWQTNQPPTGIQEEKRLVGEGTLHKGEAFYLPADVETGKSVTLHGGSVYWNAYRQRWIMIAVESGGSSSFLGEVWYLEADAPAGPWLKARKIMTHERYSFYNPVQHAFFDQEGGQFIYFEGTYANTFSGNSDATPRYDYNQIMYRLDLSDARLKPVQK